jgi:hypothetical protein
LSIVFEQILCAHVIRHCTAPARSIELGQIDIKHAQEMEKARIRYESFEKKVGHILMLGTRGHGILIISWRRGNQRGGCGRAMMRWREGPRLQYAVVWGLKSRNGGLRCKITEWARYSVDSREAHSRASE